VNGGKGSTAQWLKGVRDVKVLNGLKADIFFLLIKKCV